MGSCRCSNILTSAITISRCVCRLCPLPRFVLGIPQPCFNQQGELPTEIGHLNSLTYLKLSQNYFNGEIPPEIGNLKNLQLVQLQGNRLKGTLSLTGLNEAKYKESSYVSDCGSPSYIKEPISCNACTMCCEYFSCSPAVSHKIIVHFLMMTYHPLILVRQCVRRMLSNQCKSTAPKDRSSY